METELRHPLLEHKIAILRDVNTDSALFRSTIEEITLLMTWQVFLNIKQQKKMVQTPLEVTEQNVINEDNFVIVPILRAGLSMINGVLKMLPRARVGHIGLYRDHDTLMPKEYYCKLPDGLENKVSVLLDPMLATGGSYLAAIKYLKDAGAKDIKIMAIIAAPEGLKNITDKYKDIDIYYTVKDQCLDKNGYILPGLGDAGDRTFGTK